MAKALGDLPSDLGLEAVDKFSMANLDTVRSKTGFMVSIVCLTAIGVTAYESAKSSMTCVRGNQVVWSYTLSHSLAGQKDCSHMLENSVVMVGC